MAQDHPDRRLTLGALLLAAALLHSGPAVAQEISNPDLYGKSLQASVQALEQFGKMEDREAMARVAEIGYRIAAESGFKSFPFTFHLIEMPVPNAFALPGGQIFLTRGMLELELDDDMLAALLGHEIAHVVREHGIRMRRRATLLNAISQAVLVGVIVGAADGGGRSPIYDPYDPRNNRSNKGDLIQGTAATGLVVSELLLRSYSREFEDEADEEGQRWAAGAGYDPDGTRTLMERMRSRLPETREYGYWRTHPFMEDRAQAAAARYALLEVQPREDDIGPFRRRTQEVVLEYAGGSAVKPEVAEILEDAALAAWPIGQRAEAIRLEKLAERRTVTLEKRPLYRDFAALIGRYREQAEVVAGLDPDSALPATLEKEIGELDAQRAALFPEAEKVLQNGIYETEFLETFLSNFPDAPQAPEVALALGDAYSRLGRQTDAVTQYLAAWRSAPESPAGVKARRGLANLAPTLSRLGALQQLAQQDDDPELAATAGARLTELAGSFTDMANGSEYLRRFPDGPVAHPVTERLNRLADGLYGEVVLYQTVGDHAKALARIQRILEHAPLSPAAEKLRNQASVAQG